MIKDFKDGNKDIITMFRGTDAYHLFRYVEPDGSTFLWDNYDLSCEGRIAILNEVKDFTFTIVKILIDADYWGQIKFPKDLVTASVRESKIYYRVVATHKTSEDSKVINYGEIWLL